MTAIATGTFLLAPKGLHVDHVTRLGAKRVDLSFAMSQPAMRRPRGNVDRDIARGRLVVLTADQGETWAAKRDAIRAEHGNPNSWSQTWDAYCAALSSMSTSLIEGLAQAA